MTVPYNVHTEETTVITPEIRSYQQRLRSRCSTEWLASVQLYTHLDTEEHRERSFNLRYCRTEAYFVRHKETGKVSVLSNHCGLRWCPLCANARANYIRHSISEWLPNADYPKFLTLTIKHSNEPLGYQVAHLYGAFRRLRLRKSFNNLVTGGVWFFQICRNTQKGEWHPHIHCVITGKYIHFDVIKKLWKQITIDSDVINLKTITEPDRVANEVARYASRPAQLKSFGLKQGIELYEAMHGKRLCGKWGLFTKVELSVKRNPDMGEWEKLGSWGIITHRAQTDEDARAIIRAWETNNPLPENITYQFVQDSLDGVEDYVLHDYAFEHPPPEKSLFES